MPDLSNGFYLNLVLRYICRPKICIFEIQHSASTYSTWLIHGCSNLSFDTSFLLLCLCLPLDAGGRTLGSGGRAGGGGGQACGGGRTGRLPQRLLHLLRQVGHHLAQEILKIF